MEDLWKLTRLDYRLSPFVEHAAYEEFVRRYHAEEDGTVPIPVLSDKDQQEMLPKE